MNPNEPNGSDLPMQPGDAMERHEPTMPLTVGDFAGDQGMDALAGAESGKRFKSGTILVALVVAVAIGGLVSMRTLAKVTAASTGSSEIEQSIEKWRAGMVGAEGPESSSSTARVNGDALMVLNETYSQHQVPLGDVAKNPFVLPGDGQTGPEILDPVNATLAERDKQIARARSRIERAGGRLEVKMIMDSENPLANISGQIVGLDDVILVEEEGEDVEFLVTAMTEDVVTVVTRVPEFELEVELDLTLDR